MKKFARTFSKFSGYRWLVVLFIIALLANFWWLAADVSNREPIAVVLALVFAAYGVVTQLIIPARQNRRNQLVSLLHEIAKNLSILDQHYSKVPKDYATISNLQRIHTWATESCLTSGVLHHKDDGELFNVLHEWHDRTAQINSKIEITQGQYITASVANKKNIYNSIVSLAAMPSYIECTKNVGRILLTERYVGEHEISGTTVIFADDPQN